MWPRIKLNALLIERARQLGALKADMQVERLVRIATTEDVAKAVQIGQYIHNPFVLRAFYNEIANVHYQELVRDGRLVKL